MTNATLHPLAKAYLRRLRTAAEHLPVSRRAELIDEIEAHLAEALPLGASETEVRNVLERLGKPAEIVAEACSGSVDQPAAKAGALEVSALILLPTGGLILPLLGILLDGSLPLGGAVLLGVLGWLPGVILLWISDIWTKREKLIGSFVLPGGLGFAFVTVGALREWNSGTAALVELLAIASVVPPVVVTIRLARRARRTEAAV